MRKSGTAIGRTTGTEIVETAIGRTTGKTTETAVVAVVQADGAEVEVAKAVGVAVAGEAGVGEEAHHQRRMRCLR